MDNVPAEFIKDDKKRYSEDSYHTVLENLGNKAVTTRGRNPSSHPSRRRKMRGSAKPIDQSPKEGYADSDPEPSHAGGRE